MKTAFFIAKRYLIAKKSHNAINIISALSVVLVAIGTTALVAIMSVFNGLENLVGDLNQSLSSDLLITPDRGAYFDQKQFPFKTLQAQEQVLYYSQVLEDHCLLRYSPPLLEEGQREMVVSIRGIDQKYLQVTRLAQVIIDGESPSNTSDFMVLGNGVAARLQINLFPPDNRIQAYYPNDEVDPLINPLEAIRKQSIAATGVFSVQQEVDDQWVISSLDFVQKLTGRTGKISAVLLHLKDEKYTDEVQSALQKQLGTSFVIKNRYQQNDMLYKIMKSEKWSSFLILSFILFIATFNLVGALSVLIIDKQKDLHTLQTLGAGRSLILRIFMIEGLMVSLGGTLIGLTLGALLVSLQYYFAFIPMQGNFVVDSFPVALKVSDLLIILAVVVPLSMLAVWVPVRRLSRTLLK